MSKSPKHWTKAFFGCQCKSDMVDNDICEAFNFSIMEGRYQKYNHNASRNQVRLMTRIVEK
ncbi:hypothetical protein Goklo_029692, partial [Gossypium klotzschianum]|nr:hypothetical protein [Gossypium klotzschianum]